MYSLYRLQRVRLHQVSGYYEEIIDSNVKKFTYKPVCNESKDAKETARYTKLFSIAVNDFYAKKSARCNWVLVEAELLVMYTSSSLVLIVWPHLLHRTTSSSFTQSSVRASQQVVVLYCSTLLLLSPFISSFIGQLHVVILEIGIEIVLNVLVCEVCSRNAVVSL